MLKGAVVASKNVDQNSEFAGFILVGRTDEVQEGKGRVIKVNDKSVALFRVDGRFYAINNICPHQGGPLGKGKVKGFLVTCPWHDLQFDIRSGFGGDGGGNCVASYDVKIDGSDVYVSLETKDVWSL